jgi:hypothetical protein
MLGALQLAVRGFLTPHTEGLASPVVSFFIDESTDISHTQQMILYIVYVDVKTWERRVRFLKLIEVNKADAKSLHAACKKELQAAKTTEVSRRGRERGEGVGGRCAHTAFLHRPHLHQWPSSHPTSPPPHL